jgi:hypothetical protein
MSPVGLGNKITLLAKAGRNLAGSKITQPVVVRPLLSSTRRVHLKTRKSLGKNNIWSWVPTGPEMMIDSAGEGQ